MRRRPLIALAAALLTLGGAGAAWRLLLNKSLLDRSVLLMQVDRPDGRTFQYAGRIGATRILLVRHGGPEAIAAVTLDTGTRALRRMDGLTALLQGVARRHGADRLAVSAAPRGDRVIWTDRLSAGLAEIDGKHSQAIDPGRITSRLGPRDGLWPAAWSPDGSRWALTVYGAGTDYTYGAGLILGTAGGGPPVVLGPRSWAYRTVRPEARALTNAGVVIATDFGCGAFAIDASARTVTPFILDGLEHDADNVDYRITSGGRLVWVCRARPDLNPPELLHWMHRFIPTPPRSVWQLHANSLDGAHGREIGNVVRAEGQGSLSLCGVSPDGRWADFTWNGSLYEVALR